jgi:hypothetical protein
MISFRQKNSEFLSFFTYILWGDKRKKKKKKQQQQQQLSVMLHGP